MASRIVSNLISRGAVSNKCGRCKNRTTNPSGFCYLHEGAAKDEFAAKKSSDKTLADASLVLVNGSTPISQEGDHRLPEHRAGSKYIKELEADLANSLLLGHPIFLHGPPGVGKSAIVENFAAQYDGHIETVIGGQMNPTDIAGLPYSLGVDEEGGRGGTATDTPEWGKRLINQCKDNEDGTPGRPGVLFFDELTNTDRQTQAAMLRLINERVFPNGDKLPKAVGIFAAGNVGEDAVVTEGLGGAMKNRFSIRGCHPPVDDFREGLATAWGRNVSDSELQMRSAVASFILKFPNAAYDKEQSLLDDDTKSFPTYRSWDKLAEAMGRGEFMNESHLRNTIDQYIGDLTGGQFWDYLSGLDLPDPNAVIEDPSIVKWNDIPADKAFAIMMSIRQGGIIEREPIKTLELYAHVADSKSQQYAASTLGGFAPKVRDAWLAKGNYTIQNRDEYIKDPTYTAYREAYGKFSDAYKEALESAGLGNGI